VNLSIYHLSYWKIIRSSVVMTDNICVHDVPRRQISVALRPYLVQRPLVSILSHHHSVQRPFVSISWHPHLATRPLICVFMAPSPSQTPTGPCFRGTLTYPNADWSVFSWHPHLATRPLVCVSMAPSSTKTPTGVCFCDNPEWQNHSVIQSLNSWNFNYSITA
jgi:hypothetical protein